VALCELPLKSSVGVAVARGLKDVTVLGTLNPPFPLSTLRSGCKPTIVAEDFAHREKEICGVTPYFCAPVFKGKMVDSSEGPVWSDPYVEQFLKYKNVHSDERIWRFAVDDFVDGMEKLAGIECVRPLSDYEAWMGVEDTDIGSVNLKTSTGAPFFQRKENFVRLDHVKKEVYVKQIILDQIDEILKIIDMGIVFSPMCSHSLKDEAISILKMMSMLVRVFVCLPLAFNFLLKKYFYPFALFMRAHKDFFEAQTGMNPFSFLELGTFLSRFLTKCSDRFGDGDFAFFDGSQSSQMRLAEGEVWQKFSVLTQYSARDQNRVRMLFLGTVYTLRFVKNDLVLMAFQNPSGGQITLETNGIGNSLAFRYCYYAEFFARRAALLATKVWVLIVAVLPPKFRVNVALGTTGDDNLYGVSSSCRWLDHQVLVKRMAEVGLTYTTADKNQSDAVVGFKSITEVSFVKRRFRQDEGRWKARLELKSLVKMLVFAKQSELSRRDHAAVLVSNVNRELYYHGREVFDSWMIDIRTSVEKHYLYESRYCRLFDYDTLDEMFKSSDYPRWIRELRSEDEAVLSARTKEKAVVLLE